MSREDTNTRVPEVVLGKRPNEALTRRVGLSRSLSHQLQLHPLRGKGNCTYQLPIPVVRVACNTVRQPCAARHEAIEVVEEST